MVYKVSHLPKPFLQTLPFIGDDIAKIGQIIDIYATPCSPTPTIWVLAFFTAIPTAAYSLLKPQLIDINIKHRRGKPRKGKKFKFTAGMLVRDAIIEIPVPRWVPFTVYEFAQRIGWYFLVADTAEDFTINWMSTAYKWNGCQADFLEYIYWKGEHLLTGTAGTPTPRILPSTLQAVSRIEAAPGHFGLIIPGTYRCTWTVTFEPYEVPAQNLQPYTTYIQNLTDGQVVEIGEVSNADPDHATASGSVIITLESGRADFAIVGAWTGSGFCYCDLQIAVDRLDKNALSPDP